MKIKVLKSFYDRECDLKLREPKDELDVSEPRAKDLISKGFAEEVRSEKKEKKTESEK